MGDALYPIDKLLASEEFAVYKDLAGVIKDALAKELVTRAEMASAINDILRQEVR